QYESNATTITIASRVKITQGRQSLCSALFSGEERCKSSAIRSAFLRVRKYALAHGLLHLSGKDKTGIWKIQILGKN
ncbi:MAG TPA: hypothetical protein PKD90_11330, partial [Phnomibacter sp.]|nr:hypothetical protein [Phnomibacter sp.]